MGGDDDYWYDNSALSNHDLKDALGKGPVAVLVNCGKYGGHGIFVDGHNGDSDTFTGYDPEGHSFNVPYDGITSYNPSYLPDAHCTWFGTTSRDFGSVVTV